jgi:crotonobetainyl-CoA:carnitine CoA-transferase CaiB-like acyl-CoA transferase
LVGLRVLELAEGVAGEFCGKLLSDFGAEVIKLERPEGGSPTRRLGPFKQGLEGAEPGETSGLFAFLNTNKVSVALDVESPAGAATLLKLLERVDAVIDDHAPGWLAKVGLDPERLAKTHPKLLVCSITPYGQAPSDDRLHAEDLNVFQASGWGLHTPSGSDGSRPPLKGPGRFLTSYETGMDAAICVVSGLYRREESGRGDFIDISKQAALTSRIDYMLGQMVAGDLPVSPDRKALDMGGPSATFPCREGYGFLWLSDRQHWGLLRELMGDPQWAREFPDDWVQRGATPERLAKYREEVAAFMATQDRNEISERAQKVGIQLVPVNDPSDLPRSPQFQHRGYFTEVDHPVLGKAQYPTVPYKLSRTPPRITSPAPLLGQHTQSVLTELTSTTESA